MIDPEPVKEERMAFDRDQILLPLGSFHQNVFYIATAVMGIHNGAVFVPGVDFGKGFRIQSSREAVNQKNFQRYDQNQINQQAQHKGQRCFIMQFHVAYLKKWGFYAARSFRKRKNPVSSRSSSPRFQSR